MVQSAAFAIGVMKTDFDDRVETTVPNKPFWINFPYLTVESQTY